MYFSGYSLITVTTTKKLLLGFGTLTALLLLFGIALTVRLRSIESNIDQQANIARVRSEETRQLQINTLGYALAVRTYEHTGEQRFRQEAIEKAAATKQHLDEYKRLATTPRQAEMAAGFETRWNVFEEFGETIFKTSGRPQNQDETQRFSVQRVELERFLVDEMQLDAAQNYNARQGITLGDLQAIMTLALILLAFFVFVAATTSVIVGRSIVVNERLISENRELLSVTVASIGDAVMTTDSVGRITFLNRVAQRLTGWTQNEAAGLLTSEVFRIVNEKTREPVPNPVDLVLRDGAAVALANHTTLLAKGGGEVSIDDSGAAIMGQNGEVLGAVLVFRDITDHRQAEQILQESEEKYRILFDSIDEGYCIIEMIFDEDDKPLDYRFLQISPSWVKQTGLPDAVGKTIRELVPQMEDHWFTTFGKIALTGEPSRFESRAEAMNRWYDVYAFRFGKPENRQVAILFNDITNRKHDESRIALLARMGEITRTVEEPEELLFAVATAVGMNFNAQRCLFNEIDLDNDLETVHRDYFRKVKSVTGKHKISEYSNLTLAEMQAGRTVVNRDSQIDPRTAEFYEKTYAASGERSYVAVPLMRGGQWVASLWVSDDAPRNWSDEDVRLLESIGERSWLAVEKLRSEAAQRESEDRFAKAFNASPLAVTITSLKTSKLVEVNDTFVEMTGYSRSEAIGRSTAELGLWERSIDRDAELETLMSSQQIRNSEYIFRMKGGTEIVGLLSAELLEIGGEPCALTVIQDITQRKASEEVLSKLAAIVESTDDAILSKNLDGVITSFNAGAERLFGYTAQEAIGQPVTMLIPPDRFDEEPDILERIRHAGRIDHYETVRRRKDGTLIDVSLTVSPLLDSNGRVFGASKIVRDITERKLAEKTLRESEGRLRLATDAAGMFSWEIDLITKKIKWSENVCKIIGCAEAEITNDMQDALFFVLPSDRERLNGEFAQTVSQGKDYYVSAFRGNEPEKERKFWATHALIVYDAAGSPIRTVGVTQNLTASKLAEKIIRESEENFRTLANSMSQLSWMTDADGYIFWYNERWFEYTGTTLEEMQGWGWQSVHHPAAVERVTKKFKRHIALGKEWEDTFLLKAKTGEYRWFLSRAVPIRNADGEITRWFGTNTDVDDVRRAEEILQRSREELETRVIERTLELAKANDALMKEHEQRLRVERDRIRLLNQLVTTQEDERRRIARDLHDELGQQVTALRLKLENAKEICNEEPVCDEIDATQSLAQRLDDDIGFLAWELRPATLSESGLPATLTAYVKEWSRFTSIAAEFHAKGFATVNLTPDMDLNLYRIAQEALNNVFKYADAKNVSVLLENRGSEISLIIEDDGRGFDFVHEQSDKSGLGLIGMHERAALLGGTLEIESSQDGGTTIFTRVPLEKKRGRKTRVSAETNRVL